MLTLKTFELFRVTLNRSSINRTSNGTSFAMVRPVRFSFLYFFRIAHAFTGIGLPTCDPRLSAFGSRSTGIGRLTKVIGFGSLALGSRAGTEVTLEPHLETRGIGQRVLADYESKNSGIVLDFKTALVF